MILNLNHIAIISSSEESIAFYNRMGFETKSFSDRGYDKLYFLEGNGITLEIFVDSTHPKRVDRPEAMGLRHLAFDVDNIEQSAKDWNVEIEPIRVNNGQRFTFFKNPDNLPIEIRDKG